MAPAGAIAKGICAGIELAGSTLRYAEVDLGPRQRGLSAPAEVAPGPRLLRMGACDFDFEVAGAILDPAGPTHLDTVATAIREIFSDSRAERLSVAVHPWHATSFFAPLPAGMPAPEKMEQLRQEAAMLSDARLARSVRVSATPVRLEALPDGRHFHWHHVLRLSDAVHARIGHVASRVGAGVEHVVVDAAAATARVMTALRPEQERLAELEAPEEQPFALGVGLYGDHVELSLCRGGTWFFSQWTEAVVAADGVYFAASMLDSLAVPPARVERLFIYGEASQRDLVSGLESLLATEARPLDPLRLFRLVRSQADPLALAAFAPSVGAAMVGG